MSRLLLIAFSFVLSSGCFAGLEESSHPVPQAVYTPPYYEGEPVFFDHVGRPVYYKKGVRHYVPPTYVFYQRLIQHFQMNQAGYYQWYRTDGYRHLVKKGTRDRPPHMVQPGPNVRVETARPPLCVTPRIGEWKR